MGSWEKKKVGKRDRDRSTNMHFPYHLPKITKNNNNLHDYLSNQKEEKKNGP